MTANSHLSGYRYETQQPPKGFVVSSNLMLIAFATVFFPRLINSLGAPSPINFMHLCVVPVFCAAIIITSKARDKKQLAIVRSLLIGLLWLLTITSASALVNNAGWINIFLELVLLTEPLIVLAAIIAIPFTLDSLSRFRKWLLRFAAIHLMLAFGQKVGLATGLLAHTRLTIEDNIQGVFYLSSGGHVVAAAVSTIFALYYYISAKAAPLWLRGAVLAAAMFQVLLADAKQVILVGFIAWILLIISRTKNIEVTLRYVITAVLVGSIFYWCVYNVEMFAAYQTWIRPAIYGPQGDATLLKTSPFRLIPAYYTSALNWFFGLGPGHTIGRIGGWMIRDYWNIFGRLGATTHPVTQEVWSTWNASYLDSSFFSPFWGWAGIWGDLGLLGVGSFAALWIIVLKDVCKDDFSRFLVLHVVVNGLIFTLMEEPGFVVTSAVLIGLRWHELHLQKTTRQQFGSIATYASVKLHSAAPEATSAKRD